MATVGLFVLPLIMLLVVLAPVMIGVYVYRDSSARGMNAVLWTLIAVLGPVFTGLLIYLIVRADSNDNRCPKCSKSVKTTFSVCPYCGASLKEHCRSCNFTLEPGWVRCPNCGDEIPVQQRTGSTASAAEEKSDRGLKYLLLAIIAIPVLLCILMIVSIFLFNIRTSGGYSSMFMEQILVSDLQQEGTSEEVSQWVESCDAKGEGIYVLTCEENSGDQTRTKFILYRNDGMFDVTASCESGGFFTDAEAEFRCIPYDYADDEVVRNYTLAYLEFTGDESCNPVVYTDNVKEVASIEEISSFAVSGESDENLLSADISVSDQLNQVYGVSWDLYQDGKLVLSEGATIGDGDSMAGENAHFLYRCSYEDEMDSFVIKAQDQEGNTIFESQTYATEDREGWSLELKVDQDGGIVIE